MNFSFFEKSLYSLDNTCYSSSHYLLNFCWIGYFSVTENTRTRKQKAFYKLQYSLMKKARNIRKIPYLDTDYQNLQQTLNLMLNFGNISIKVEKRQECLSLSLDNWLLVHIQREIPRGMFIATLIVKNCSPPKHVKNKLWSETVNLNCLHQGS